MELCNSNDDCVCVNCCAVRLHFFSVDKLEFKALASFNSTSDIIRYDEYFSMSKLSNLSLNLSKQDFFILHFNVRSLPKNINKLDEFLNDFQRMPDAIAISETKLNSDNFSGSIYFSKTSNRRISFHRSFIRNQHCIRILFL